MAEPPPLDPNLAQNVLLPPIKLAVDGMTGAFLIDPDRAQRFIAEVGACADMLNKAARAARDAGDIKPPGGDPVTENAVLQANKMATNAERTIFGHQQKLFGIAAGLQADLSAYRATEQANTPPQT